MTRDAPHDRTPIAVLSAVAIVVACLGVLLLGAGDLPARTGPPVEQLTVERTFLSSSTIEATVRNTGQDPVQISQIFVNDVYVSFSGATRRLDRLSSDTLRIDFPWQDGQPYLISIMTSTGAIIEHHIPVAVATPPPDRGLLTVMALLGTYVGILPVLSGMALLPLVRRAGHSVIRALLGLTVGLLAFLAVDAALEGLELTSRSGGAFGGPMLVFLGAGIAFLALTAVDRRLRGRSDARTCSEPDGRRLAVMIAIGIGLHNFGEGLAIGSAYAIGELALGAALIVGFAVHNTTEGLAIVTPLTDKRPSMVSLLGLGLLAGAPASLGAMAGAAVTTAEVTALLLGVGVGAIIQVVTQIAPSLRSPGGRILNNATVGGLSAGLAIMYLTGLFVAA